MELKNIPEKSAISTYASTQILTSTAIGGSAWDAQKFFRKSLVPLNISHALFHVTEVVCTTKWLLDKLVNCFDKIPEKLIKYLTTYIVYLIHKVKTQFIFEHIPVKWPAFSTTYMYLEYNLMLRSFEFKSLRIKL